MSLECVEPPAPESEGRMIACHTNGWFILLAGGVAVVLLELAFMFAWSLWESKPWLR